MFQIIISVLGHLKGVGRLTSNFLCEGGMDVFWNDSIVHVMPIMIKRCFYAMSNSGSTFIKMGEDVEKNTFSYVGMGGGMKK
jgi:hypothetical protein